jgi:hypothetical protein
MRHGMFRIQRLRSLPHHQPRRVQRGRHVRQFELDRLVRTERRAKLFADLDVLECLFECGLGGAKAAGGDVDAAAVQAAHGEFETFAFVADPIRNGDPAVLKDDGSIKNSILNSQKEFKMYQKKLQFKI